MLKGVNEEFVELKPIALLIGSQNETGENGDDKTFGRWIQKNKRLVC